MWRQRSVLRVIGLCVLLGATLTAIQPEVLRSSNAVPSHIAGRFREATGFQQSAAGQYFVFDRRGHTVYGLDEQQTRAWEIVQIGAEPGRIIDPTAPSLISGPIKTSSSEGSPILMLA